MKTIVIWGSLVTILTIGVFGLMQIVSSKPQTFKESTSTNSLKLDNNDNIKGAKTAKAILIEYSDFQCPACATYYPLIKHLGEEYKDRVQFVYRHFPLQQHKNAKIAAFSAEAAGLEGKFWEMHDLIFEKQAEWANQNKAEEIFLKYAQSLNLKTEQFRTNLFSREIREKVESDYQSGILAGVNGTPTFFLNGKKLDNPRSYDEFKKAIDNELASN